MASTARAQEFINEVRDFNRKVWEGINGLKGLQAEWNALEYGNNLPDGLGSNDGVTRAEVGAVVFDSADNLKAVLDAGTAGNMAKLL